MLQLENHHFAALNEIMALKSDHQWLLKPWSEGLEGSLWWRRQADIIGTHGSFLTSQEGRQADIVCPLIPGHSKKMTHPVKYMNMNIQKALDLTASLWKHGGQRHMVHDVNHPRTQSHKDTITQVQNVGNSTGTWDPVSWTDKWHFKRKEVSVID